MGKAARPSGTEWPVHTELKFTDGVFCSMPSFAIHCTVFGVYSATAVFLFLHNF